MGISILSAGSIALGLVSLTTSDAETPKGPVLTLLPYIGAQHDLTQDVLRTNQGCTYRRTAIPGAPVRWILVPQTNASGAFIMPTGCAGML